MLGLLHTGANGAQTGFMKYVQRIEICIDRLGSFKMHDGSHYVRSHAGANLFDGTADFEPALRPLLNSEQDSGHR
jgi:hypothetical protein